MAWFRLYDTFSSTADMDQVFNSLVVPEPTSAALAAIGMGAMLLRRCRGA